MKIAFQEYLAERSAEENVDSSVISTKNIALMPDEKDRQAIVDFIDRIGLIGSHIKDKHLEYDEFIEGFNKLPEPKINVLYYQKGDVSDKSIRSIMSSLLLNPTDTNLKILEYLVETYPDIEFHKAIDIRHTFFDTQQYIHDDSLRSNAQKMLNIINQKASEEDKNRLGLVNLAIFYDHFEMFKELVDNPNTSFEIKGQRQMRMFDSMFMHPKREEIRRYFFSNDKLMLKVPSFRNNLLYQMTVSCSIEELNVIFRKLSNHKSFQEGIISIFSLDFSSIVNALENPGIKQGDLEKVVAMHKLLLSNATGLLDFSTKFEEQYKDVLSNALSEEFGIGKLNQSEKFTAKEINNAIFSIMDLMLLYQPQLIKSDPITQVYAKHRDTSGLFFKLVLNENDKEFLNKIFKNNQHVEEYLDQFFALNLSEQINTLLSAGLGSVEKFSQVMSNFTNERHAPKIERLQKGMQSLLEFSQEEGQTAKVGLLAKPQMIRELFADDLSEGQEFAVFFRDLRQIKDKDVLSLLSNEGTKGFLEEFSNKSSVERKRIIESSGVRDKADLRKLYTNLQSIGADLPQEYLSSSVNSDFNRLMREIEKPLPKDYENRGFFYKIYEWLFGMKASRHISPSLEGELFVKLDLDNVKQFVRNNTVSKADELEATEPEHSNYDHGR